MKSRDYKIYVLKDPTTLEIRYVGVTCKTINGRLSNHIYYARKRNCTHLHNWILSILNQNKTPLIEVIEIASSDNWEEREKYWISFYKPFGLLTNLREGGAGVVVDRSLTSREKSAAAHSLPIVQLNITNNLVSKFDSITKAAKMTGISKTNIGNVLAGRNRTAGGYKWFYKTDYEALGFNPGKVLTDVKGSKKEVVRKNLENGEEIIYSSLEDAATANNLWATELSLIIRKDKPICIFMFKYI